jgi:hypothetical protein
VPGRGLFIILGFPASSTWWTLDPWQAPLIPLAMGRGLSRRIHPVMAAVAPPGGGHCTFSTLLLCGFTPTDDFVL